jgi:hypothetical protein
MSKYKYKSISENLSNHSEVSKSNKNLPKIPYFKIDINSPEHKTFKIYENSDLRLNNRPPVIYYRKVTNPYKYKMDNDSSSHTNPITTEKLFSNRIKSIISKSHNGKLTLEEILKKNDIKNKDHFKPNGYIFYDYLRKHPYLKPNDLIRTNIFHSIYNKKDDYFDDYDEKYEKKEEKIKYDKISEKDSILYKYQLSDPFNLRDDKVFKNKSGELYLLKEKQNKNKENFDLKDNDLLNEWIPKYPNRRNFVGYTSVKFNILNPGTKSIFKTKDEIELGFKPSNKTKSISEFLELSRVNAPNLNKRYNELFEKNPKNFGRENYVANDFGNLHHTYREMIPNCFG